MTSRYARPWWRSIAGAIRASILRNLPWRPPRRSRSEEHTSELQSPYELVCRLLLEKKNYREVVIDLERCAMMDSTFMGTMAAVALRLKELGQGHLHVVHCRDRRR